MDNGSYHTRSYPAIKGIPIEVMRPLCWTEYDEGVPDRKCDRRRTTRNKVMKRMHRKRARRQLKDLDL